MMFHRTSSVALLALSCALALLSECALASSYSYATDCYANFIGDGDCDLHNDNEDCGK